ncbi:carbonic anhydrase 1 [Arctopsyche grandis]|uniref:carbonic anhydrase 1 n=1 Tax=Arctopsyche grandis TaxID=121162 RepID=UPI00406DA366
MSAEWGYTSENGPSTWIDKFPAARGERQSPVDITTSAINSGARLPELTWKYSHDHTRSLVNPGYCWKVEENGRDSEIRGGPLGNDTYRLVQFHAHWGCTDCTGSEHTVNGKSFSAELHLVHWNCTKYKTLQEAFGHPDGLAVFGVFLKVGKAHPELEKIARVLPFIMHKGDKITMNDSPNPNKLLPENRAYWTYPGSLTTPPCNESVTWILFKEPIEISAEQLAKFRGLRTYGSDEDRPCDGADQESNYRPPLPLGNRDLRECGGR